MIANSLLPRTSSARPPACSFRQAKDRGSLLIVAMIISAVIGISLVSYIKLSSTSYSLANRSFYQSSAMNLAEIGIEEAIYCYNLLDDKPTPQEAWTSVPAVPWKSDYPDVRRTTKITGVSVGPNATGEVRVYCSNFNPGNTKPDVVAKATITFADGRTPPIEKWLHVKLRKRSYWANGMVARNSIVWTGGVTMADSWNSDDDGNPATPGVPYNPSIRRAGATVGTPSSADDAIDVGGGAVYGEMMTGGGTIDYSASRAVLTSDKTVLPGSGTWNGDLVSTDFDANFPPVTVPAPPTASKTLVTSALTGTLPLSTDPRWNGVAYYEFSNSYNLQMNTGTLTITGPVVFLATAHSGKVAVDLSGTAKLDIAGTGRLAIYTNGDVEMTGGSIARTTSSAGALQILGTNASGQSIKIAGNADAVAAIYAPTAEITLSGNVRLQGAAVGRQITVNGTSEFHYDEALATTSTGNPYGIERWRELQTATERAEFATYINAIPN